MGGFFFFQAEDGIRDYKVTGVQTCALPIFRPRGGEPHAHASIRVRAARALRDAPRALRIAAGARAREWGLGGGLPLAQLRSRLARCAGAGGERLSLRRLGLSDAAAPARAPAARVEEP